MSKLNKTSPKFWLGQLCKPLSLVVAVSATPWMASPLLLLPSSSVYAETSNSMEFSQAELEQMLAPIALYPDVLLSQVLIASTYPLEVVQADRWARSNKDLKGDVAIKFVENKDWDSSVKALVAYPDLLQRMSENLDWTQRLGDAFLSDEGRVMDAVQNLRSRAANTGSLEKAEHVRVIKEDRHIVIEPREERVVYVPVYDPVVVYGRWWWSDYPPVVWGYPSSYVFVNGFYWGPSVYFGSSFYYTSGCRWRDRRVVVVDPVVYRNSGTRFYTNVSITRYSGAREWRHDPIHRRGVAYYDDRTRTVFHSNRESYERDRQYRNDRRDDRGDDRRDDRRDDWRNNTNDRHQDTSVIRRENQNREERNPTKQNRFDDRYLREHPELNRPRQSPNDQPMIPVVNNSQPREVTPDRAEELQNRMREREQNRHQEAQTNNQWQGELNSRQEAVNSGNSREINDARPERANSNQWQNNAGQNNAPRSEQEARDRYYRQQQEREVHTSPIENSGNSNNAPRHGIQVIPNSAHFPEVNNTPQVDNRADNNRFNERAQRDVQQSRFERPQEQNVKQSNPEPQRENRRESRDNRFSRERNE